MAAWALRLRAAEVELLQREQQARAEEPTTAELSALAVESDRIAVGRDRIADLYDEQAETRDLSALGRDVSGSGRDRRARVPQADDDEGWPDRFAAGVDRDLAAGDRADSHGDRARAHESRAQAAADRRRAAVDRGRSDDQADEVRGLRAALRSRHVIGQAQGLLMARHGVGSETAFALLVRLSQTSNTKLRDLADSLVRDAEPGAGTPVGAREQDPRADVRDSAR